MVCMTAHRVGKTEIGHIHHEIQIGTSDRFSDVTSAFACPEAAAFTVHQKRLLAVALRNDAQLTFRDQLLAVFDQLFIHFLSQIPAALQGSDPDRGDGQRFLK